MPYVINGKSVTEIGAIAFFNNNLTSVTILTNITIIRDGAFMFNKLTKIIIPDCVTTMGITSFSNN